MFFTKKALFLVLAYVQQSVQLGAQMTSASYKKIKVEADSWQVNRTLLGDGLGRKG